MPVARTRPPDVGPDPEFRLPACVRHTLRNGLELRTIQHDAAPVVTCAVQIAAGSSTDPPGREGLAALTADMADEGTGSLSAVDVDEALARIGAEYDVEVGPDAVVFSLTTLARFAERGVLLLADLLLRPSLREADFERVRQLRRNRLRQLRDMPSVVADLVMLRLLYGGHPYGHLSVGRDGSLRDMHVDDVRAFHRSTFRPDRATVVAIGPFGHADLAKWVDQAFGGWSHGGSLTEPEPGVGGADQGTAGRVVFVPRKGAQQSELRIGQLSTRRNSPDYLPLTVMNAVLGGQFVSRVNLKLREEKGYTYGAMTGFDWHRGPSPFMLQASVDTAVTGDAVRDALEELRAIRGPRPVLEEELFLGKASLTRGYPRRFETGEQLARSVLQLALYDLPDSYFEDFVPGVHQVTVADVTRVAERYVSPAALTTLVVGDPEVALEPLRALDIGDPELLTPEM